MVIDAVLALPYVKVAGASYGNFAIDVQPFTLTLLDYFVFYTFFGSRI